MMKASKRKTSSKVEGPRKKRRNADSVPLQSPRGSTSMKQEEKSTILLGKTSRDDFSNRYKQLHKIGEGGFGSVYAGTRTSDQLPVAIKQILKSDVKRRSIVLNGIKHVIPLEVLLMCKAAGEPEPVGKSAAVSLLEWYDLDREILLVMERPEQCVGLLQYLEEYGPLNEAMAKILMKQLVEAYLQMDSVKIFHRDIKSENILIQLLSHVPRVRVIDFGCGCILRDRRYRYRTYSGTHAYIPPEFRIYGSYEAGPTTVWQLGAVLFEMVHKSTQFNTEGFLEKKCRISTRLSQRCRDLLNMCLAQRPEDRATLKQIAQHPWLKVQPTQQNLFKPLVNPLPLMQNDDQPTPSVLPSNTTADQHYNAQSPLRHVFLTLAAKLSFPNPSPVPTMPRRTSIPSRNPK